MIVRDFQSVIGRETPASSASSSSAGCPTRWSPASAAARTRRGCSAPFIDDAEVELVGAEAGGRGLKAGEHAASLSQGQPGVLHGSFSYVLQDDDGQTSGRPLDLGRPRLSRRRPRAQLLEGQRPGPLREHHRRRGPRRLPHDGPARRHPAGPRVEPRPGPGLQGGPPSRARQGPGRLPLRPRRQGRLRGRPAAGRADLNRGSGEWPAQWRVRADNWTFAASSDQHWRTATTATHHSPLPTAHETTMNRIDTLFSRLKNEQRRALMPFVTAGDPDLATTALLITELFSAGRDLVEVGIPYSDPIADGPVIAASYHRALERGVKVAHIFQTLRTLRAEGSTGAQRHAAGVDGLVRDHPSAGRGALSQRRGHRRARRPDRARLARRGIRVA